MEIDFESLLKKYIQHVSECEGCDFINSIGMPWSEVKFTEREKEWLELAVKKPA